MRAVRLGGAAAVFLSAAGFAVTGGWPWRRLERPVVSADQVAPAVDASIETSDTLQPGETLSHLFTRQGVTNLDPSRLRDVLDPRRLPSGLEFRFRRTPPDSVPSLITARTTPEQRLTLERVNDRWHARVLPIRWEALPLRVEGAIDNSLYQALDDQVGDNQLATPERQRLAWDLADVYAWQVDFTRDIRPGDRFRVLLERQVSEEGEVRFGRVLASDLTISGKSMTAFRFETEGRPGFFDADGNSLRRAFLRAPVQFRRISSNFARARFHPILGINRRHEGTDYSAAPGTPVMAAANGVVLRAGWAGGYGNLVDIRHRSGITTRYGHLRGFARGIHAGARVRQSDIVGYVGSTGLATASHLHYEFRVGGVARDPRRVDLGSGEPIAARLRPLFERERQRLASMLLDTAPPPAAQEPVDPLIRWHP